MKYCRGPQRSVCVKVWSWSQDIRTVPSRCSQSAAGHILTVAARNDCLGPERSESEWGVDDVCLVELRFWGSMGTIVFHLFSIRSSLGSILNLDIACSTHTFHAQPASASTPFMWHENYAKLSWKLKAFSAVWSEWKRVEEWSLIVVACNKTMLRWSYTVWLYDIVWYCMITHDSMSLGSALRATSPTEAACYNRSTLPHFSSTYHLEHLTRVKFVKVVAIKNRVPFTDGPIESYRYQNWSLYHT